MSRKGLEYAGWREDWGGEAGRSGKAWIEMGMINNKRSF
jgi:hypothetical protein